MNKKDMKLKGFGLIETLVACAILMIICGALLTINLIITRDIAFAKGRAVAYNLAQEAIESARQIRDTNLLDNNTASAGVYKLTNWNSFVCNTTASTVSTPVSDGNHYYKILALPAASTSNCYGTTSRITMVSDLSVIGEPITIGTTTYTRKIRFLNSGLSPVVVSSAVTEENAIRMVAEISWTDSGNSRHIEVTELLTNWKRGF